MAAGGADNNNLPTPPQPPLKRRQEELKCGTLADRARFDVDRLDWIRRSSPVLHVINAGTDGGPLPAAEFWEEVAKNFPKTFSLCSRSCSDMGKYMQTMDDWGIDFADAPERFMDMVFGGRSKRRKDRQKSLDEAVADASSPGVAQVRRIFRDLHFRFAAMMDTWHDRLAEPAMLRAALICPAHPRVDAYVRAKLTKERLAAAARTYDAAFNTVKERWRYWYATPAPKLQLVMELMCDAYGTGRLNWLQWMDQNFEIGVEESVRLVSMAVVHHSDPMNTSCLEWLLAHSRTVARLRSRNEPEMWAKLMDTVVYSGSDTALRLAARHWQDLFRLSPVEGVIRNGDLARVKLMLELGCPQHPQARLFASASGSSEMIEFCAVNAPEPAGTAETMGLMFVSMNEVGRPQFVNDGGVELRRRVMQVHAGFSTMQHYGHFWPGYTADAAYDNCLGREGSAAQQNAFAVSAAYYHGAPLDIIVANKFSFWGSFFSISDANDNLHSFIWLIAHGLPLNDNIESDMRDGEDDDEDEGRAYLDNVDHMFAMRNLIRQS